jgi:hypothetical protein
MRSLGSFLLGAANYFDDEIAAAEFFPTRRWKELRNADLCDAISSEIRVVNKLFAHLTLSRPLPEDREIYQPASYRPRAWKSWSGHSRGSPRRSTSACCLIGGEAGFSSIVTTSLLGPSLHLKCNLGADSLWPARPAGGVGTAPRSTAASYLNGHELHLAAGHDFPGVSVPDETTQLHPGPLPTPVDTLVTAVCGSKIRDCQ